jgi:hypothetical protein
MANENENENQNRKSNDGPSFWDKNKRDIKVAAYGAGATATGFLVGGMIKDRVIDPMLNRGKDKAKEKTAETATNFLRASSGRLFR